MSLGIRVKTCSSCHLRKDESGFSIRKASRDGLTYVCKPCKRAYDNNRLPSIRDKRKLYRVRHYRENRERLNKEARDYRKKYPLKVRAREAVRNALRDGRLHKEPCYCGEVKVEAHHEDYSRPLNVEWLCNWHHKQKIGE